MTFRAEEMQALVEGVKGAVLSPLSPQEFLPLIDLTSLSESDTQESIAALCQKAVTPQGSVAAVCVYPRFVAEAAASLKGSTVKVATVVNFPGGQSPLEAVRQEILQSLQAGAEEIDLVFPYETYLKGEHAAAKAFVSECKAACSGRPLKVILETGALKDLALIAEATEDAILAGADFIKTSTGKLVPGATLEAAATILLTIKTLSRPVGLKVSGGIRQPQQAQEYWLLAKNLMGQAWPSPQTFRLGTSQLLDHLQ